MQINILIDNSGSMDGEPILRARNMTLDIIKALNNNSETKFKAEVCIITYNIKAVVKVPIAKSDCVSGLPGMNCCGPKNLGEALKLSSVNLQDRVNASMFILTKGSPSDAMLFQQQAIIAKSLYKNIYVLHGNMDKASVYNELTKNIVAWECFNAANVINNIYGGHELLDSNGREMLSSPPKVIEL